MYSRRERTCCNKTYTYQNTGFSLIIPREIQYNREVNNSQTGELPLKGEETPRSVYVTYDEVPKIQGFEYETDVKVNYYYGDTQVPRYNLKGKTIKFHEDYLVAIYINYYFGSGTGIHILKKTNGSITV